MKNRFIHLLFILLFLAKVLSAQTGSKSKQLNLAKNDWEFSIVGQNSWMQASIPGCVHTDLLLNSKIDDPYFRENENRLQWIGEQDWEYRCFLTVDDEFLSFQNIELQFDGLDTYCDVYLNDNKILYANNFFRTWKVDCKKHLRKGENCLRIVFTSSVKQNKMRQQTAKIPLFDDNVYTRKPAYHYGWDWGPVYITQGIWRTIYLKAWNDVRICNLHIHQESVTKEKAMVNVVVETESSTMEQAEIVLKCLETGKEFAKNIQIKPGSQLTKFSMEITSPKLWWTKQLGVQNFYHFNASVTRKNQKLSELTQRTGLRSLKLVQSPDSLGKTFYFELNGVPVFMKGANYIPQDMFLNRITERDYVGLIKQATDANMNMLRVWGGGFFENDIFYNLCDENGILVWQDFMFACSMYPGDSAFLDNVKNELIDNIKRLRNHPSIALWCGNNENYIGWKDWRWKNKFKAEDTTQVWADYEAIFHKIMPEVLNTFNPGSNYWPSSPKHGWGYPVNKDGDSHYWGIWHAQEPFEELSKPIHIPRFMSEFGFQGCPDFNSVKKYTLPSDWSITSSVMKLHQKHRIGYPVIDKYMEWYYKKPKDFNAYLYVSQILQARGMGYGIEIHRRSRPHCMGTLYWQINDCYPVTSWASVDYYDQWKAMHYMVKKVYADILVSTAQEDSLVQVYIVSDKLTSTAGKLKVNLVDFSGRILKTKEIIVKVKANTSKIYFSANKSELLKNIDEKACLLTAEFTDKEGNNADNVFYFVQPKDLELSKPQIELKSTKTANGYKLVLSTNTLAKNVFLSFDENEGFFSENYFDIIPGKPVSIEYTTVKEYMDIRKSLKIYSLIDSF